MDLLNALELNNETRPIICLAGAGGKTTLLYRLCDEFRPRYKNTCAFTTTHIMRPSETDAMALIIDDDICLAQMLFENGKTVIAGTQADENKISAPNDKMLTYLLENSGAIVAEADGSRNLPLKFPNADEPCLINGTSKLYVVAGLSALGKPLCEVCHRWPLAMAACGISGQHTIVDENIMAQILVVGYGKYNPIFILNQADDEALAKRGMHVCEQLSCIYSGKCVVISLQEDKLW